MLRLGWFSTGRDRAARDLLRVVEGRIRDGTIKARIAFVFCNRTRGEADESDKFLDLVEEYGFPLVSLSSKDFKPDLRRKGRQDKEIMKQWRIEYDRKIDEAIASYEWDLGILAGYMLIVGEEFCATHPLINLHPAAPDGPKGSWQEVIWKLIEKRADRTGVMIHLVTAELDRGPVITYCEFPIRGGIFDELWTRMEEKLKRKSLSQVRDEENEHEPLFAEIRRQGLIREFPLIVHTIKQFADGNLRISQGQLFGVDGPLSGGYCLTEEINKAVEQA